MAPASPTPARLGYDPASQRSLYLLSAETATDITRQPLTMPGDPFACILVWDAAAESVNTIAAVTEALLRAGCIYLCTWGSDCERVHDICDENLVEMTLSDEPVDLGTDCVMTSWHDAEPLQEALRFFLCDTHAESHGAPCRTGLALTIGASDQQKRVIHGALTKPDSFVANLE